MFKFICKKFSIGLLLSIFSYGIYGNTIPEITAQSWLVADDTGKIISGTNTKEIRSIASITKLMTAMVVLDSKVSLTEYLPKTLYNRKVTRQDLIELSIVNSDNTASKMLCDFYPKGYIACIESMNNKAKELKMIDTVFTDPTGRYHSNVSTAEDLIKLVTAASQYKEIVHASNMDAVRWSISKRTERLFVNTNSLVRHGYDFIVSKTGWIRKSGGCIVMMLQTANGLRTVILLGSKNTKTRIPEAYFIATSF